MSGKLIASELFPPIAIARPSGSAAVRCPVRATGDGASARNRLR